MFASSDKSNIFSNAHLAAKLTMKKGSCLAKNCNALSYPKGMSDTKLHI
jgi:hypothetical protein